MTVWLTVSEAARHVKMKDTRRITQAIKDGELPSVHPFKGNMIQDVRIDAAKLDEWMNDQPFEPGVRA